MEQICEADIFCIVNRNGPDFLRRLTIIKSLCLEQAMHKNAVQGASNTLNGETSQ